MILYLEDIVWVFGLNLRARHGLPLDEWLSGPIREPLVANEVSVALLYPQCCQAMVFVCGAHRHFSSEGLLLVSFFGRLTTLPFTMIASYFCSKSALSHV